MPSATANLPHTPAPWTAESDPLDGTQIVARKGPRRLIQVVATVSGGLNAAANVRLIVEAPVLHSLLAEMVVDETSIASNHSARARACLARIRGEAS